MTVPALFLTIVLMFIGASPGGTGGGVKTTTFGVMVMAIWATIRNRADVTVFHRRIAPEVIARAFAISLIAFLGVNLVAGALLVAEGQDLLATLYETVSAFGTVGLSMGVPGQRAQPLGRLRRRRQAADHADDVHGPRRPADDGAGAGGRGHAAAPAVRGRKGVDRLMKKQTFAVIGLGRFGSAMATTLAELGHEVIGIDGSQEIVERLADRLHAAVALDATDERALKASGIQEVDCAVISIGENIEASLLVVMLVKDLGIREDRRQGGDAAARPHPRAHRRRPRDLPRARHGRARRPQPGRRQRARLHRAVARLQHHRDARAAGVRRQDAARARAAQPLRPRRSSRSSARRRPATAR